MRVATVIGFALSMAGCTGRNPLRCDDGVCSDPSHPFCDVGGELDGEPHQCIAVTCTPGQVDLCRGDVAVTCNAEGTDYDQVQCERGCDVAIGGCRLCNPNETACTNGTVATCDASGEVVASEPCALGCFENEPRCREIASSNALDQYLEASRTAPDLVLATDARFDTVTGQLSDLMGNAIPVSTVVLPAPPNGAAIRVVIARNVRVKNLEVYASGMSRTSPALAIVAGDTVQIDGTVSLWREEPISMPGGLISAACSGVDGVAFHDMFHNQDYFTGGGGGGHATAGGNGGGVDSPDAPPSSRGGAAAGGPSLEPLRGGCAGGNETPGGGAIQITSRTAIVLGLNAAINANGHYGSGELSAPAPTAGGSAGGGILLEAPLVRLESSARVLVNGGPAGTESQPWPVVSVTRAPSPGGTCNSSATYYCGNGGNGASADGPNSNGALVSYTSSSSVPTFRAAGGGGGLGYVRINTKTGQYEKASDVIESGMLTTSEVRTR